MLFFCQSRPYGPGKFEPVLRLSEKESEMSKDLGLRNPSAEIGLCGLNTSGLVRYNASEAELIEFAVARGEAVLTAHGALRALTGQHTGRSAKDKFVVRDAATDGQIWWDNNKPMSPEAFDLLHADMAAHAKDHDLFRSGSCRRCGTGPCAEVEGHHRICVARPLHPQPADPSRPDGACGFRAAIDRHQSAVVPRRSGASWLPFGNGDRRQSAEGPWS